MPAVLGLTGSVRAYGGALASPGALGDEGQGRACQHGQAA